MAVFLHPQYKLGWFSKHWCESEKTKALAYIQEQYNLAKSKYGTTTPRDARSA
jgi:hypothetical protein